ncbi:hypothetical protein HMPREF0534_0280 [Limosilactobacillus reuteri CF48-3A]|uniref:Uncharacterized protein n=2 Tax=Limosilactobacillus reuteri TaxID=1598 RepID=F8DR12_LIMRS|nr:hypothetical protein HMPREF0538_21125 [Limosilactobacillus reuteri SD2112]EEI66394.1 hypothetical protein HMPREF0534_0280 [Limosilactobacillus reuteri CF48-3A]
MNLKCFSNKNQIFILLCKMGDKICIIQIDIFSKKDAWKEYL